MSYRKVDQRLWSSTTFRAMSEDARGLYQYLLTSPHNNALCCYRLPDGYGADDLQWELPRYRAALAELEEARRPDGTPMIVRDAKTSLVMVWGQIEKEGFVNPNAVSAAIKCLSELPSHSTVHQELLRACERLQAASQKEFILPLLKQLREQLGEQLGEQFTEPRAPVQEQEHLQEFLRTPPSPPAGGLGASQSREGREGETQEPSQPPSQPLSLSPPDATPEPHGPQELPLAGQDADFEEFWRTTPVEMRRGCSRAETAKAYRKARAGRLKEQKRPAAHAEIMAGLLKARDFWALRGSVADFIPTPPMATTWLRQLRWGDSYSLRDPPPSDLSEKAKTNPYLRSLIGGATTTTTTGGTRAA